MLRRWSSRGLVVFYLHLCYSSASSSWSGCFLSVASWSVPFPFSASPSASALPHFLLSLLLSHSPIDSLRCACLEILLSFVSASTPSFSAILSRWCVAQGSSCSASDRFNLIRFRSSHDFVPNRLLPSLLPTHFWRYQQLLRTDSHWLQSGHQLLLQLHEQRGRTGPATHEWAQFFSMSTQLAHC